MVPPREAKEAQQGGVRRGGGEPSPSPHMLSHPPPLSREEPDLQMGTGTFSGNGLSRILNLKPAAQAKKGGFQSAQANKVDQ